MNIYILRTDEMEQIRLSATNVWRINVENAPRTLKSALPILFDKLTIGISKGNPIDCKNRKKI
jgi:hypothetical protein